MRRRRAQSLAVPCALHHVVHHEGALVHSQQRLPLEAALPVTLTHLPPIPQSCPRSPRCSLGPTQGPSVPRTYLSSRIPTRS